MRLNVEIKMKLMGHTGKICQIGSNSKFLFSCSIDGSIRVWNILTDECVYIFKLPEAPACFDASEEFLFVGCNDKKVRVLDLATKAITKAFVASEGLIKTVYWYNNVLYVAGYDPVIRGWDIEVLI